jgi:hypothetical protein
MLSVPICQGFKTELVSQGVRSETMFCLVESMSSVKSIGLGSEF